MSHDTDDYEPNARKKHRLVPQRYREFVGFEKPEYSDPEDPSQHEDDLEDNDDLEDDDDGLDLEDEEEDSSE